MFDLSPDAPRAWVLHQPGGGFPALCQLLGVYEQVAYGNERKLELSKCAGTRPKPTLPLNQTEQRRLALRSVEAITVPIMHDGGRADAAGFASASAVSRPLHLSGGNADRLSGGKPLPETDSLASSPLFSPRGEAKCVRSPSVQGARRSAPHFLNNAGVLKQYVEHGEQAQRSNGELMACFDRQVVRNTG